MKFKYLKNKINSSAKYEKGVLIYNNKPLGYYTFAYSSEFTPELKESVLKYDVQRSKIVNPRLELTEDIESQNARINDLLSAFDKITYTVKGKYSFQLKPLFPDSMELRLNKDFNNKFYITTDLPLLNYKSKFMLDRLTAYLIELEKILEKSDIECHITQPTTIDSNHDTFNVLKNFIASSPSKVLEFELAKKHTPIGLLITTIESALIRALIESEPYSESFSNSSKITRRIEFSPDEYQAGLGIITYFHTYLKENYPNEKATITIEQQTDAVRMVIEPESGDKKIVEKALNEYALIISGEAKPERFVDDKILIAKLYTRIDLLNTQLKAEKRLNNLHESNYDDLRKILALSVSTNNMINVNVSNNTEIHLSLRNEFTSSISLLKELKDCLIKEHPLRADIDELTNILVKAKEDPQKNNIKKLGLIPKLKSFISKINKAQDLTEKIFFTTDRGIKIFKKIIDNYNSIQSILSNFL